MDVAHEAGIDFFDVANRYGREPGETETIIGWVLRCSVGGFPPTKAESAAQSKGGGRWRVLS